MDTQLVQRTRYLLKARVKTALTCPLPLFQAACQRWLFWLSHHPVFSNILSQLARETGDFVALIDETVSQLSNPQAGSIECPHVIGDTITKHAAFCLCVIQGISQVSLPLGYGDSRDRWVVRCFAEHLIGTDEHDSDKALETVRDVAIQGLYEYLDEQLDARNALLGLLIKYKHRSEWFRKRRMRDIAENGLENQKGGERALAIDLYEYVFDQSVDFSIEPASASGEADLIARDSDGRYIVIDAKYISPIDPPSKIKEKLAAGFHQVARYCEDHNESYGYLVPYINHKKSLRLPLEETDGFRYLTVKGKIIYYIPVDIGDHPSASKSGPADEIDISKDELLKETSDAAASIVSTD